MSFSNETSAANTTQTFLEISATESCLVEIALQEVRDILVDPGEWKEKEQRTKLHVFVDDSNVFYGGINQCANQGEVVDMKALLRVIQQGRRAEELIVVGSGTGGESRWRDYDDAGYTKHILPKGANGREIGVDDTLLSLVMRETNKQFTNLHERRLVLVTGDGNDNIGRVTFPEVVESALGKGWTVEVWSWDEGRSSKWRRRGESSNCGASGGRAGELSFEETYSGTGKFSVMSLDHHRDSIIRRRSAAPSTGGPVYVSPGTIAIGDSAAAAAVTAARSQKVCRFGRGCTRRGCWFPHPQGRKIDESKIDETAATATSASTEPPAAVLLAAAPPATPSAAPSTLREDPGWRKGTPVIYTASDGCAMEATIVQVHREDVELYYTIFLPSTNRERQTTLAKLSKRPGRFWNPRQAGSTTVVAAVVSGEQIEAEDAGNATKKNPVEKPVPVKPVPVEGRAMNETKSAIGNTDHVSTERVIKARFNGDLRRIRVGGSALGGSTYAALVTKLAEAFPALSNRKISTTYVDDEGDCITIASTTELVECYSVVEHDERASIHLTVVAMARMADDEAEVDTGVDVDGAAERQPYGEQQQQQQQQQRHSKCWIRRQQAKHTRALKHEHAEELGSTSTGGARAGAGFAKKASFAAKLDQQWACFRSKGERIMSSRQHAQHQLEALQQRLAKLQTARADTERERARVLADAAYDPAEARTKICSACCSRVPRLSYSNRQWKLNGLTRRCMGCDMA
jgi:hypothetical protein